MSDENAIQNLTPKKRAFLAAFSLSGNISQACRDAGISRPTVYEWLRNDPDFPGLFADAREVACDLLEEEARRRAVEGVVEPVFGSMGAGFGSGQIGSVRKYSDTLLIFLMKGARPEVYRERIDARHSGAIDGGATVNVNVGGNAQIAITERKTGLDQLLMVALDRPGESPSLPVGGEPVAGHDPGHVPAPPDAPADEVPDTGRP